VAHPFTSTHLYLAQAQQDNQTANSQHAHRLHAEHGSLVDNLRRFMGGVVGRRGCLALFDIAAGFAVRT
jgi:hypothetical protein